MLKPSVSESKNTSKGTCPKSHISNIVNGPGVAHLWSATRS